MRGISLYEPWATLIALGEKRYETRSWSTAYRGPLLICASKRKLSLYQYPPIKKVLEVFVRHGLFFDDLEFGYALAIVDLTDVYRADDLLHVDRFYGLLGENEKFFGNFSPGRFAWKLENIRRLKNPIPIKGKQGLFNVPDDLIKSFDSYESI